MQQNQRKYSASYETQIGLFVDSRHERKTVPPLN